MNNVGTMLMDELAYAQTRIDSRKEETKKLCEWRDSMQDVLHGQEDSIVRQSAEIDLLKGELTTLKDLVRALVAKTGTLEDDKVRGRG
jgi:polyhydroxyalkanoate synthesis regulator phasin